MISTNHKKKLDILIVQSDFLLKMAAMRATWRWRQGSRDPVRALGNPVPRVFSALNIAVHREKSRHVESR